MNPHPTGRVDGEKLIITRTFRAPIEDVWTSVTKSESLERWFGRRHLPTATGVQLTSWSRAMLPASNTVAFGSPTLPAAAALASLVSWERNTASVDFDSCGHAGISPITCAARCWSCESCAPAASTYAPSHAQRA